MTRDPELIGLIEGYLDDFEGNTPLPDATRDAIRAELPSISQRPAWWPGWRFPEMNTMARVGLGAAAAVAAVAIVSFTALNAGGNVGGDPGLPEIPSTSFTSDRHHYTLLFPDDSWEISERPGIWAPATLFNEQSAGLDVADKVGESEPWVLLSSQPMDLEREAWLARHDDLVDAFFSQCSLGSSETRTVDGEQARINEYLCDGDGDGAEAIMVHGDRVYALRVFHGEDEDYDPRPLLDEFLDIFRFRD